MSFGTELQSKPSHEALLGLQEFEIKLLEHMKKCIIQRIKIDKEYSSALSVLAMNMVKFDSSEYHTPVYQVWQNIGKETENLSSLVKESADKVCVNSLDKLQQLISEKKMLKKIYQEERNRLDNECNKMNDDVNKLAHDYNKSLEKLQRTRWKHEESSSKGKINPKQEDMKIKLLRQEIQANLLHNEYIIALKEAILQDKQFNAVLLPALMQFQQSLQTSIVKHCQDILTEYVVLSDMTSSQFQQVHRNMLANVNTIDPIREYNGFISRYKSNPVKLRNYEFSVPTYLPLNEIVVGDLSRPYLEQRTADYSTSLDKCQHWLSCKALELVEAKKSLADPTNSENSSILSYLVQCRTVETLNREVIEQQCLEDRCLKMLSFLNETTHQNQRNNCTLLSLAAYPELADLDLTNLLQSNVPSNSSISTDHIKLALSGIRGAVLKMKPLKKQASSSEKSQYSPQVPLNNLAPRLVEGSKDILSSSDLANNNNISKPSLPPKPLHQQTVCQTSPDSEVFESEGIKDLSKEELDNISHLEIEDWYHGVLPREEVQKLLLEEGDFLVRVSKNKKSNETQYVLSVLWRGAHKHFIIQEAEENEYKFEGASYPTVQELIWHHFNNSEPITKRSEAILRRPVPREIWELRNDDIELREKIGSGQFGEVYKGFFKTTGQEVGVKTCRETMTEADKLKFLQEGRILKQYNHPNIVKFIGIAVHRHPVMIVMEFVPGGSLVTFLRQHGAQESAVSLLKMCKDVASGMAYLESKNCLHRDLAARNCLVGENGIVKISDFGMSREEREYIISGGLKQIPIKWTAPEALNFGVYTWACDVWSFGILVWEVFSEGGNPYPGMTNSEAKIKVDDGYRMSQPTKCPPQLYELVLSCWNKEPKNRPHFHDIYNSLVELEEHI